jgi:hypothetical protein
MVVSVLQIMCSVASAIILSGINRSLFWVMFPLNQKKFAWPFSDGFHAPIIHDLAGASDLGDAFVTDFSKF